MLARSSGLYQYLISCGNRDSRHTLPANVPAMPHTGISCLSTCQDNTPSKFAAQLPIARATQGKPLLLSSHTPQLLVTPTAFVKGTTNRRHLDFSHVAPNLISP